MKTKLLSPLRPLLLSTILAIQAHAAPASAASLSEMLEKGIYSEETKGDIDEAIAIYQQLVADAKSGQSFAAQAQFRLAQCYLKKSRAADATAAFEKLIHDFPDEKELIAKAREHLPGEVALEPVPWVNGERLRLNVKMAAGLDVGTTEYRADLTEANGRKIWRVGAMTFIHGSISTSAVDADAETFRPIASHWKVSQLGEVSATYKPGEVELQRVGVAQPTVVKLGGSVFDNEEAMDAIRRFPLKNGFKSKLTVMSTIGGMPIPIGIEITGIEAVETPAGKFDCFRLQMDVGQTFWFSTDAHRYLVKFEAGPVVAELVSITRRGPGEFVEFRDDGLGVSLTAPPDWLLYSPKNHSNRRSEEIKIVDTAYDLSEGEVRIVPTETLPEESRKSPKDWAETDFRNTVVKSLKDVKIRPESWKDRTVSGHPGISYVADFKNADGKPRVAFTLLALGSKTADHFYFTCAPKKFDALMAEFEGIIASYKNTK